MALAMLLSSITVFNCKLVVGSDLLEHLNLVCRITQRFRISQRPEHEPDMIEPAEYARYFPSLVVVLRDAQLKMVNSEGKPCSPNEYLNDKLRPL